MEIDDKLDLNKICESAYYKSPEFIKSVYVELLAIKLLLVKKEIITFDEIDEILPFAQSILDDQMKIRIEQQRKQGGKHNEMFNLLEDLFKSCVDD